MAAECSLVTSTLDPQEKRHRSIFDVPADFFDACRLLSPSTTSISDTFEKSENHMVAEALDQDETDDKEDKICKNDAVIPRWTCNTCKAEFESLQDQRSHFKSDIHRINVKLSIAGKDIVNEEDLDDLTSNSLKDYDISSISGSEDEADKASLLGNGTQRKGSIEIVKQKLFIRLNSGEKVSLWKCVLLNDFESVSYENDRETSLHCLKESDVIERLKFMIHEPRDKTRLRIVLLASGGHFAGCVLDGNSVVAHKTFHRYVVRAKAGKTQSSKDGAGRAAHSAGASLRRYNELALKKDIQELLAGWKPYFAAATSVFVHAPSSNRHLLYDGDNKYFVHQHYVVRNIPLNVRRPTLKEARRIYNQLTQFAYEVDKKEFPSTPQPEEGSLLSELTATNSIQGSKKDALNDTTDYRETRGASSSREDSELIIPKESECEVICVTTSLHEAAQSGNTDKVLELLEQGMDPSAKDERGRTPYMLASGKEVRNTFRRFMAANLERWDWHAAKVPSALTKEMEESQAAKQAEKDAKKKARAKEVKKVRRAKEKAQAQDATAAAAKGQALPTSAIKEQPLPSGRLQLSKEEELKRGMAAEREKRAAAAERRIAAAQSAKGNSTSGFVSNGQPTNGLATDSICSCCNASLAGKIPFHRYNYKYCSTTCMHLHREALEDG